MSNAITQTRRKLYLGDGAYADWDASLQQVKITAENGVEAYHVVYVEPSGMEDLLRWWERVKAEVRA